MSTWMMPASEAKAISEGNRRVMRTLGLISQMIFERAHIGDTYVFLNTTNPEYALLDSLNSDERKTIRDVLFDYGYMMIPMYNTNPRGREDIRKLRGYNIDWSGMYE